MEYQDVLKEALDQIVVQDLIKDIVDEVVSKCATEVIFQPGVIADEIFKKLDIPSLMNCRLVSKSFEETATKNLSKKDVYLNVQKMIEPCCTFGPVPLLYNPLTANKIKYCDKCPRSDSFIHPPKMSIRSASKAFMIFCKEYGDHIQHIRFKSPTDQYPGLREVLFHSQLPKLKSIGMHVTEAAPSPVFETVYGFDSELGLECIEIKRRPGFKPSGTLTLFESLVTSSPKLKRLVLGDYLYPEFPMGKYQNLRELVIDVSPFMRHNSRTLIHDLFMPQEIRRILFQLRNTLESLTLISADPLHYGYLYGNGQFYARMIDPRPLDPMIPNMPNLKRLKLHHSEFFAPTHSQLACKNLPKLETLEITRGLGKNLSTIKLFLTPEFLGQNFTGNASVKSLHLDGVDLEETVELINTKFPSLKKLTLIMIENQGNPWSANYVFEKIAEMNLKELHFSFPSTFSVPEIVSNIRESYYDWDSFFPTDDNGDLRKGFLGTKRCTFTITAQNGPAMDKQECKQFTDFLKDAAKDMEIMEFLNFTGTYESIVEIKKFIKLHELPVYFKDN